MTAIPLEAFPLERSVENYPSINDKRRHFRVYSSFAPSTISSLETEEEQTTLSFIAIPSGRAKLERQFKEAQEEIYQYGGFLAGWDGYDAKPFTPDIISLATQILSKINDRMALVDEPLSRLTPGPASDGSVDIEIALAEKYCRFTIYPDKVFCYTRPDRQTEEFSFESDFLERKLSWILK